MKNPKTTQLEIWPNRGPKKVFSLQDQYTIGEQAMRIWKINNCEELSRCDSKFSWLFYDEISEDPMFGVTGLNETKQMDFRLFEHPWEWKLVSTFDGRVRASLSSNTFVSTISKWIVCILETMTLLLIQNRINWSNKLKTNKKLVK